MAQEKTGKEMVYVRSTNINNASISVKLNERTDKVTGEKRFISRSYTFRNFIAKMPYGVAKMVVFDKPKRFSIVEAVDTKNKELVESIERHNIKADKHRINSVNSECPFCDQVLESAVRLGQHIYFKHRPKHAEWKKKYMDNKNKLKDDSAMGKMLLNAEKSEQSEQSEVVAKDVSVPKKEKKTVEQSDSDYENARRRSNLVKDAIAKLPSTLTDEEKQKRAETLVSGIMAKCCGEKK